MSAHVHLWSPLSWQAGMYSVDMKRCRASVPVERGPSHQCGRKASIYRCVEGEDVGFCATHDPEAVARRDAARKVEWDRKHAAEIARWDGKRKDAADLVAFRKALESIATGHNDPRSLAAEVLGLPVRVASEADR